MKKVLILKPRLDIPFKKGLVPKERQRIDPIREHWGNFVDKLEQEHKRRKNNVKVLELPSWQFTPEIVEALSPDQVYIPHKQAHQFPVNKKYNPYYYMQMVFPWLFQVDSTGWGPDASIYPIEAKSGCANVFDALLERQLQGSSKFEQPEMNAPSGLDIANYKDFVFFPCQIPHDETIRFHSKVSVAQALQTTMDFCKERKLELIVKGHPANPGAMAALKEIGKDLLWADDVNINQLISQSSIVVMVNSGVGMEAILHGKPVVTFGKADYVDVVHTVETLEDAYSTLDEALSFTVDTARYRDFINTYVESMYDSRDIKSFEKCI